MFVAVSVAVLVCSVPLAAEAPTEGGAAATPEGGPSVEVLDQRISRLESRADLEEGATEALAHARQAVTRARALAGEGDVRGARRARQIAAAALLLAQRRVALVNERAAHRMAEERLARARARLAAAVAALQHAIERRDRVREGEARAEGGGEAP
jgi:phosphopantothenate synthetase